MFFFFFNGPATTESYTYLHTLSLHDALPIFLSGVAGILKCHGRQCQCEQQCTAQAAQTSGANPDHVTLPSDQRSVGGLPSRSEEHTSELQSLMRISYAVFCLKKKIKTT